MTREYPAEAGAGRGLLASTPDGQIAASVWLRHVVDRFQILVGDCTRIEPSELVGSIQTFLRDIPEPRGVFEHLALRGFCLELAIKGGYALHERLHCANTQACGFDPAAIASSVWRGQRTSDELLLEWAGRFAADFDAIHGTAILVRQWLAENYDRKLDLKAVVQSARTDRVRREFRRSFGVSPHGYQTGLRTVKALEMLTFEKASVSAVASQVGYKSKKDLYRALWRSFAQRPTKLRSEKQFAHHLLAAAKGNGVLHHLKSELVTIISARSNTMRRS